MAAIGIIAWIATGLLAAMYLMAGFMKAKDPEKAQASSPTLGAQSVQKLRIIGGLEILGAIGIVLPAALGIVAWLSGVAAVGFVLIQALAIPEHIKHKDTKMLPMNSILLALAAFVALVRFGAIP